MGGSLALEGPASWPPWSGPCWKNCHLQVDAWAWSTRCRRPTPDRSVQSWRAWHCVWWLARGLCNGSGSFAAFWVGGLAQPWEEEPSFLSHGGFGPGGSLHGHQAGEPAGFQNDSCGPGLQRDDRDQSTGLPASSTAPRALWVTRRILILHGQWAGLKGPVQWPPAQGGKDMNAAAHDRTVFDVLVIFDVIRGRLVLPQPPRMPVLPSA